MQFAWQSKPAVVQQAYKLCIFISVAPKNELNSPLELDDAELHQTQSTFPAYAK